MKPCKFLSELIDWLIISTQGRRFDFWSRRYEVFTIWMSDCLRASCYITLTNVNSALHPSRVDSDASRILECDGRVGGEIRKESRARSANNFSKFHAKITHLWAAALSAPSRLNPPLWWVGKSSRPTAACLPCLGLWRGVFTCDGWQVTPCDPVWQVTLRSSEVGFPWIAILL